MLDYDGTLAPIATHPDLAYLPAETKSVLQRLSKMPDVFIAIISGRNVENVKRMVSVRNIELFSIVVNLGSCWENRLALMTLHMLEAMV